MPDFIILTLRARAELLLAPMYISTVIEPNEKFVIADTASEMSTLRTLRDFWEGVDRREYAVAAAKLCVRSVEPSHAVIHCALPGQAKWNEAFGNDSPRPRPPQAKL